MSSTSHTPHKRIYLNLANLLSGKVAAGIISLGYLAIAARTLGVHDYGVLHLLHAYTIFIGGVFAFSGWHGLVRFGHDALIAEDHAGFLRLVRFMALVEVSFFVLAFSIAASLAPIAGPWFGWSPEATRLAPFYAVAIFATVRTTPNGILQIAERFDLIGWHQIVMPVSRLIGALILWFTGGGLKEFIWVWMVSALLEGASMWIMGLWVLRRMHPGDSPPSAARSGSPVNRAFLSFIFTTNADITLRELAPRAFPLIIGWILGPAAVGLFSLAQRTGTVLEQPAQMLGHSSYAVAAKLVAEGKAAESRSAIWRSIGTAMLLGAPITLAMALAADYLLRLLGGPTFTSASTLLILILIAKYLLVGAPALSAALIALGRPKHSIMVSLAVNFALLAFLPLMLREFGLEGAGLHLIAQSLLMMAAYSLLVNRAYRQNAAIAAGRAS